MLVVKLYKKPKKTNRAQRIVGYYLLTGKLKKPSKCELCGKKPLRGINGKRRIHAHHEDYDKPLEIIWVCLSCHYELHEKKRLISHES